MAKYSAIFVALLALCGCATRFENIALSAGKENRERRTVDVSVPDRPVILVAISGGGSRASALGWNVLRELNTFTYSLPDQSRRPLIDDVAIVSTVSGGSVIGAYFGLYGAEKLDDFDKKFLVPDNMRTLGWDAVNPLTWFRIVIRGSSRTSVVEKMFDDELFDNAQFAQLNQPGKPFIILNTTDMIGGETFALTPERFDDICSDFDKTPISVGVTASAAFPILLSPVAFQNFSFNEGCKNRPIPPWISKRLNGKYAPYINIEEFKRARFANDLRHGPNSFRDIDYLYFLDGGLADNLGVHGLLEAIASPHAKSSILNDINLGKIKKVVVIVVNARSDRPNPGYKSSSRPGLIGQIGSVTSVPIDANTASVNSQLDVLLEQIKQAGLDAPPDAKFGKLRVYGTQIDFDQLRGTDERQHALRDRAKAIPTLWTIKEGDREVIREASQVLLHQHPCFQRLLLDLKVDAAFIDATFAKNGCPQSDD